MKVLLGCLSANGFGGSELYHYELAKELRLLGNDVTLFTLIPIDRYDHKRLALAAIGVKQTDTSRLDASETYDIIIVSQPQTTQLLLESYPNTPIVSIIHSEIRCEDPVLNSRINHYIAIRQPIVDLLVNSYRIPADKVSLIYNPIDTTKFRPAEEQRYDKTTGIFVGEVLDPIRFQAVSHLVQSCIENNWNLLIMSDSKYDFNHPNITYVDKRWDTETLVRYVNFTGGILLGRTTLEGLCCGVPGYVYEIDTQGSILNIDLIAPGKLEHLCDSKLVAQQHIELYDRVLKDF